MDHGTGDPDQNLPALRASDAERHETARILQQAFSEGRLTMTEFDDRTAQAYQATFQQDLAKLTTDLSVARQQFSREPDVRGADWHDPGAHRGPAHHGPGHHSPARRVTGQPGTGTSIAVMSGSDRSGVWTIAETHTAVAVMGGVNIDLREADLQSQETTIRAFAFWGGIEIIVPDDVVLIMDGVGFMGGFAEDRSTWKQDPRPVRQAQPGAPVVRVTGLAVMGGVGVRRSPSP